MKKQQQAPLHDLPSEVAPGADSLQQEVSGQSNLAMQEKLLNSDLWDVDLDDTAWLELAEGSVHAGEAGLANPDPPSDPSDPSESEFGSSSDELMSDDAAGPPGAPQLGNRLLDTAGIAGTYSNSILTSDTTSNTGDGSDQADPRSVRLRIILHPGKLVAALDASKKYLGDGFLDRALSVLQDAYRRVEGIHEADAKAAWGAAGMVDQNALVAMWFTWSDARSKMHSLIYSLRAAQQTVAESGNFKNEQVMREKGSASFESKYWTSGLSLLTQSEGAFRAAFGAEWGGHAELIDRFNESKGLLTPLRNEADHVNGFEKLSKVTATVNKNLDSVLDEDRTKGPAEQHYDPIMTKASDALTLLRGELRNGFDETTERKLTVDVTSSGLYKSGFWEYSKTRFDTAEKSIEQYRPTDAWLAAQATRVAKQRNEDDEKAKSTSEKKRTPPPAKQAAALLVAGEMGILKTLQSKGVDISAFQALIRIDTSLSLQASPSVERSVLGGIETAYRGLTQISALSMAKEDYSHQQLRLSLTECSRDLGILRSHLAKGDFRVASRWTRQSLDRDMMAIYRGLTTIYAPEQADIAASLAGRRGALRSGETVELLHGYWVQQAENAVSEDKLNVVPLKLVMQRERGPGVWSLHDWTNPRADKTFRVEDEDDQKLARTKLLELFEEDSERFPKGSLCVQGRTPVATGKKMLTSAKEFLSNVGLVSGLASLVIGAAGGPVGWLVVSSLMAGIASSTINVLQHAGEDDYSTRDMVLDGLTIIGNLASLVSVAKLPAALRRLSVVQKVRRPVLLCANAVALGTDVATAVILDAEYLEGMKEIMLGDGTAEEKWMSMARLMGSALLTNGLTFISIHGGLRDRRELQNTKTDASPGMDTPQGQVDEASRSANRGLHGGEPSSSSKPATGKSETKVTSEPATKGEGKAQSKNKGGTGVLEATDSGEASIGTGGSSTAVAPQTAEHTVLYGFYQGMASMEEGKYAEAVAQCRTSNKLLAKAYRQSKDAHSLQLDAGRRGLSNALAVGRYLLQSASRKDVRLFQYHIKSLDALRVEVDGYIKLNGLST